MKPHKQLYTTKEASELLHYKNAASIKARINEGKIKAQKIGRDWFIPASEIKRIIQEEHAKREPKVKDSFSRL